MEKETESQVARSDPTAFEFFETLVTPFLYTWKSEQEKTPIGRLTL